MPELKKKPRKAQAIKAKVKWYNEGKFGFAESEGGDLFIPHEVVDEARMEGVFVGNLFEGDRIEVIIERRSRGDAVSEILAHERDAEVVGHVVSIAKDGHAFIEVEGLEKNVFCFVGMAKDVELALGDEVMLIVGQTDKGPRASKVSKTGRAVELASRKPATNQPKAEPPKKAVKHSGKKPKADAAPKALLRGVYGIVKSFKPEKGFGFITLEVESRTDTIGPDVFVSYKAVERASNLPDGQLRDFDIIQFDVYPGRKAGEVEAQNLRFVSHEEQMKEDAAPKSSAPRQKPLVHEALRGVVDWKEEDGKPNRYGFIVMAEPVPGLKPDVFLHITDVEAAGYQPMRLNAAEVTFDIVAGRKPGEYQAANLRNVALVEVVIRDLFADLPDNAALAAE